MSRMISSESLGFGLIRALKDRCSLGRGFSSFQHFQANGKILPSLYGEVPSRNCSSTYPVFSVFNHNLAPRRRMRTIAARLARETSAAYGYVASNKPRWESMLDLAEETTAATSVPT